MLISVTVQCYVQVSSQGCVPAGGGSGNSRVRNPDCIATSVLGKERYIMVNKKPPTLCVWRVHE